MKGEVRQINGKRVATTEYRSWQMMKNRCLNRRAKDFKYYGGRGVTVCQRWMNFDNFLADMGRKPAAGLTLERKNVNGSYCKNNCLWATRRKQSQNRTDSRFTLEIADQIRKLYATGRYFQYELAKRFGTTQAAISQITRNVAWLREAEVAQ